MSIVVFLGPTLSVAEARAELDASYRPPVSHGDVLRAVREAPQAIGIVDGYFERVPSVWHKEILWALSRGVHVFGAASMGALRAAELAPFGMEGVGAVYEAFARGDLEDDDEVAVAHASADEGYRPLSVAMVDIRATLRAAVTAGVISSVAGEALERLGERLFYPDRCYPILLQQAVAEGVSPAKVEALRLFLAGRQGAPGSASTRSPCSGGCASARPSSPHRSRYPGASSTPTRGSRCSELSRRPPLPPRPSQVRHERERHRRAFGSEHGLLGAHAAVAGPARDVSGDGAAQRAKRPVRRPTPADTLAG